MRAEKMKANILELIRLTSAVLPPDVSHCWIFTLLFVAGDPRRTMNSAPSNPVMSMAVLVIVLVPVATGATVVIFTS